VQQQYLLHINARAYKLNLTTTGITSKRASTGFNVPVNPVDQTFADKSFKALVGRLTIKQ